MADGESLQHIPSPEDGGPKASELLPPEVTKETEMGKFASTVLSLIERQTGLPVTDRDKLFDFSNVVEAYGTPLVGSSQQGEWVVSGYRDISSTNGKLKGVPMTHIEIGHVVGLSEKTRTPIFDESLTIDFIGDLKGENKGMVQYEKGRQEPDGIWVQESGVTVDDSRYWDQTGDPKVDLFGNPPGINRSKTSKIAEKVSNYAWGKASKGPFDSWQNKTAYRVAKSGFVEKTRSKNLPQEIPQVIGHFIDKLPSKKDFTVAKVGASTREEVHSILRNKRATEQAQPTQATSAKR